MTSLPSRFGIGDMGPSAYAFIDWLKSARQTWWQMLPLGQPGDGACPYQCLSAMAGNANLISPELLVRDGMLERGDLPRDESPTSRIDFSRVGPLRNQLIHLAWEHFQTGYARRQRAEFEQFCRSEASWLDDYALFMALKEANGGKSWDQWPRAFAFQKPDALRDARRELSEGIRRQQFIQFHFLRQLAALRQYAAGAGIKLIGDLPIFVAGDSADVWANPNLFQLDKARRPRVVAGVPPDYFSATGQRWGNPLYNWAAMKRDGFSWWIERARMALRHADLVRIDHFRGFAACWTIPASQPTAQHGRWVKAPGADLLEVFRLALCRLPFIAEDLGVITPDVQRLRDRFNLPGMKVLQFAFGSDGKNPFLPHNFARNCVAYSGTHDNDTTAAWYRKLDRKARQQLEELAPDSRRDPAGALVRMTWSSIANIAIAPMQDLLRLGNDARMNLPGTTKGNWSWRLREQQLTKSLAKNLGHLTETTDRVP